ncbi:MAG: chitobiase/beta-hexosaminidase C-terminal domain-containing protein [Saprospirales bacterium]|nr:chitobiase/beta-hexosaminidase C-terminal domain-containing protein [Saprospirales bacterium]
MNHIAFAILFFFPALAWSQTFPLAAPQVSVDSVFFRKQARVEMAFDLDGAVVHYTINGGFPFDSTPVYQKSLMLGESAVIRAKTAHKEFLPGPMVERQIWRVGFSPDSAKLRTAPDSLYAGRYTATLFDLQKGAMQLKDGRWLGFRGDTIVVEAWFRKTIQAKLVILSTLFDAGAWIFPPARIEVYGASGDKDWQFMGVWVARAESNIKTRQPDYHTFQKVLLRPAPAERFQIRIIPYGPLPDWHVGAGQPAWFFIDEIAFQ